MSDRRDPEYNPFPWLDDDYVPPSFRNPKHVIQDALGMGRGDVPFNLDYAANGWTPPPRNGPPWAPGNPPPGPLTDGTASATMSGGNTMRYRDYIQGINGLPKGVTPAPQGPPTYSDFLMSIMPMALQQAGTTQNPSMAVQNGTDPSQPLGDPSQTNMTGSRYPTPLEGTLIPNPGYVPPSTPMTQGHYPYTLNPPGHPSYNLNPQNLGVVPDLSGVTATGYAGMNQGPVGTPPMQNPYASLPDPSRQNGIPNGVSSRNGDIANYLGQQSRELPLNVGQTMQGIGDRARDLAHTMPRGVNTMQHSSNGIGNAVQQLAHRDPTLQQIARSTKNTYASRPTYAPSPRPIPQPARAQSAIQEGLHPRGSYLDLMRKGRLG